MKKINIVLIILYLLFLVYFSIFNPSLFFSKYNVNLGFNSVLIPVFPLLFLVSFIFLLIQWLIFGIIISTAQKALESREKKLAILKAEKYDKVESQLKEHYEILMDLQDSIEKLSMEIVKGKDSEKDENKIHDYK